MDRKNKTRVSEFTGDHYIKEKTVYSVVFDGVVKTFEERETARVALIEMAFEAIHREDERILKLYYNVSGRVLSRELAAEMSIRYQEALMAIIDFEDELLCYREEEGAIE